MNYIQGSAEVKISANCRKHINVFKVVIECDANDGDYISDTFWYDELDLTELRILILSYVSHNFGKWCAGDYYGRHYGHHIADSKLYSWLAKEGWLQFAGMVDEYCHSIVNVDITYFNSEGQQHLVTLPDIDSLFDSEAEFINYVMSLIEVESNDEDEYDDDESDGFEEEYADEKEEEDDCDDAAFIEAVLTEGLNAFGKQNDPNERDCDGMSMLDTY